MKKERFPSRAWKELQRGTGSKESYDGFAALVGGWWALRRAKKSEREMIEAVETDSSDREGNCSKQDGRKVVDQQSTFQRCK